MAYLSQFLVESELCQHTQSIREQGQRRADVLENLGPSLEHDKVDPCLGQRMSGCQACGAGPDDDNFEIRHVGGLVM